MKRHFEQPSSRRPRGHLPRPGRRTAACAAGRTLRRAARRRRPPQPRRAAWHGPRRSKLDAAGIATVAELAQRQPAIARPAHRRRARSSGCASRRACRSTSATTGEPSYELLEPELDPEKPRRGFALLPQPSRGRRLLRHRGRPVLRGRPRVPVGRHATSRTASETFRAFWGRDRAEEKQAFEAFIDFVDRAPRALSRTCTSTTTRPTSRRR